MSQVLIKTKGPHFHILVPARAKPLPTTEKLLRETAFVLEMTRRVKDDILGKKLFLEPIEC